MTQVTHPSKEVLGKIATSKSFQLIETFNFPAFHGMQTSTMQQHSGEEHPPGFPSKQSARGSVKIAEGAGDRPGKPVALTAHGELGSCWSAMKNKETRGEEVGLTHRRESIQECQADAAIPAKKVEESLTENSAFHSVTAASLYVKTPPISSSGIYFRSGLSSSCAKIQERNLQKISHNSHRHPLSGPALKVIWKGNFEVLDFPYADRICEGFLAHPSVKMSSKAYEFARQIVGVLQFRVHAYRAFWPEIFQSDCPDANDIALYFYPGKIERSRKQYACLLKFIEKHDLMLRSCMGRLELLVFPSKLLHVDCQKLGGSYFMWGVFRPLKGKNTMPKTDFSRDRVVQDEEQKDIQ